MYEDNDSTCGFKWLPIKADTFDSPHYEGIGSEACQYFIRNGCKPEKPRGYIC